VHRVGYGGSLIHVTAEAYEANRPWDGRRLLRFLTGLALLALAVTLRLPAPVAEPINPPPAAVAAAAPAEMATVAEQAPEQTRERRTEPVPPAAAPVATVPDLDVARPAGVVPATGDPRAPPTR
jgi:hypothetical protein